MKCKTVLTTIVVTAMATGAALGSPLTDVYKRVQGSVVVIETEQKDLDTALPGQLVSVGGLGSGVLISRDGKILTAAHVVQAADRIVVHFLSGEQIPARVLSSEPAADLAVLQLERKPASAQVAAVGDSDRVEVGDEIFIVGAPLGITYSLTVGHISARRQTDDLFGGFLPTEQFQTDAVINEGNSGGPMFNMEGEVIGVVSYMISESGGFEGLGFVITSNMATRLLLEERRLWSGFQGRVLRGDLARIFNLPQESGVLVEIVAERSIAKAVGLQGGTVKATIAEEELIVGGDVILEVMGIPFDENERERIRNRFQALKSGDEMVLKVLRAGRIVELKKNYYPDLMLPAAPE
jgi:S1-C subfamily serine protease